MNLQIKDKVGLDIEDIIKLARSLTENRKPKEGSFNYGFETHGAIGLVIGGNLKYPIQVLQTNERKSDESPIVIVIERNIPL